MMYVWILLLGLVSAHPDHPPLVGRLGWDGSSLQLDGRPYAGVGLNIVDLALWGGNVEALEAAALRSVPFVRFAAAPYWADELQQWRLDPEHYWASSLDVAVAAAERLRIRLIPDLLWNPFAFADLCREPLAALFNGSASCAREAATEYVTQAVRRYANSSAVLFWELSNENNALVDGFLNGSTVACNPNRGTPSHRTDADNFDTQQMVDTFGWLAEAIQLADPGRLVNTGTSMPRPFAESWRETPRAQVARHHMDSKPDNRSAWARNLLDTNARTDFVSAHMGGLPDNQRRPWLANETGPVALLEEARAAAAANSQPFYLGEFTVTVPAAATASPGQGQGRGGATSRSYGYAEAVLEWVLDVNARLGGGGGVLSSIWVFEYGPQNATYSLVPGRDDELLTKLDAANRVLSAAGKPE
jgi:hypothetical protein